MYKAKILSTTEELGIDSLTGDDIGLGIKVEYYSEDDSQIETYAASMFISKEDVMACIDLHLNDLNNPVETQPQEKAPPIQDFLSELNIGEEIR